MICCSAINADKELYLFVFSKFDRVFIYTDGITEWTDENFEEFGFKDNLMVGFNKLNLGLGKDKVFLGDLLFFCGVDVAGLAGLIPKSSGV